MERNVLADKLKGYACFLVLFGHVIMGIRLAEINIPIFFHGMEKFIWSFHVALFLFLSGFVYNITGQWQSKKTKWNFIKHKLINLGIPYIIFSAVYILINSLAGQTNTQSCAWDILSIWQTPVAQYWFLYALFFLFCIWTIFPLKIKNVYITIIVVALSYIIPALGGNFGPFDVVMYSALAFGLGTCVSITDISKISSAVKIIIISAHIVTGVLLIVFDLIEKSFIKELMLVFGIYSSILFISLIQDIKPISRFLTFMNKYSFQIYLLHTTFTAGIRIILLRINVTLWWIHILAGCVAGLGFSVIAAIIAQKINILNACFFPARIFAKYKK